MILGYARVRLTNNEIIYDVIVLSAAVITKEVHQVVTSIYPLCYKIVINSIAFMDLFGVNFNTTP